MAIEADLPGAVAEILGIQGIRAPFLVESQFERVALHLLGSLLIEQQYTNRLLREAAVREKARDLQVAALRDRAQLLAGALRPRPPR